MGCTVRSTLYPVMKIPDLGINKKTTDSINSNGQRDGSISHGCKSTIFQTMCIQCMKVHSTHCPYVCTESAFVSFLFKEGELKMSPKMHIGLFFLLFDGQQM